MYCFKCGAAVVGKYCSCCGTRVRNQVEEYRRAERMAKKAFIRTYTYDGNGVYQGLDKQHMATACWHAACFKYGALQKMVCGGKVPVGAFDELETIRCQAERLFALLLVS